MLDKIENWNTSQKTMTTVREDDDKNVKRDLAEDYLCVDILKRMVMAENEDQNKEKGFQSINSPQSASSGIILNFLILINLFLFRTIRKYFKRNL